MSDEIDQTEIDEGRHCQGCGYDGPEGHCHLCHEEATGAEMLDHLRVLHPDEYGHGPQRWPDGAVVVVDTTVEPREFYAVDPPRDKGEGMRG